jgi:hypothetical protein
MVMRIGAGNKCRTVVWKLLGITTRCIVWRVGFIFGSGWNLDPKLGVWMQEGVCIQDCSMDKLKSDGHGHWLDKGMIRKSCIHDLTRNAVALMLSLAVVPTEQYDQAQKGVEWIDAQNLT